MSVVRVLLVAAVAAACGHSAPPAHDTRSTSPPAPDGDPSCPLEVPGTSITVEDTNDGAAFVFATTGDAAAVQARATAFAAAHGAQGSSAAQFAAMVAPSAAVTVAKIDHGAKLVFAAKSADDVAALQSELRGHLKMLSPGSCRMAM